MQILTQKKLYLLVKENGIFSDKNIWQGNPPGSSLIVALLAIFGVSLNKS